ncbi:MAG: hypothetical protein PHT69_06455 [Bacteroidales bacterium]|nr:hypothetical protein [Bacteroidales bacterium]
MRNKIILTLAILIIGSFLTSNVKAQVDNNVGIGTLTPHQTAILHLEATKQGFLPPCLSTIQRDSIIGPHIGLLLFNTTDSTMQYWNGECWMHVFQENCDDCLFDIYLSDTAGTINRTTVDSLIITITVQQSSGTPQTIGLFYLTNTPPGVTITMTNPLINYSGSCDMIVHSNIFATPGVYPIAVQGICGSIVKFKLFQLTIEPCYIVNITSPTTNYNLQSAANLPGPGNPICVVATVYPGVEMTSNATNIPVFTHGNLDAQSHVGIINHGAMLARGGDGAVGGTFSTFGNPGEPGGNCINMTTRLSLMTNTFGYHYAGGGGGGSVGLGYSFNIPIIGTFAIAVGAGGGGGAALGEGGTSLLGGIQINIFQAGHDATGGVMGVGGLGGDLNYPIQVPLGPVNATITPGGHGGHGGGYGQPGGAGYLYVHLLVQVTLPWPIGTITIINMNINIPINFPPGGQPGNMIKRNNYPLIGIPLTMPDSYYQSTYFKGYVGN